MWRSESRRKWSTTQRKRRGAAAKCTFSDSSSSRSSSSTPSQGVSRPIATQPDCSFQASMADIAHGVYLDRWKGGGGGTPRGSSRAGPCPDAGGRGRPACGGGAGQRSPPLRASRRETRRTQHRRTSEEGIGVDVRQYVATTSRVHGVPTGRGAAASSREMKISLS